MSAPILVLASASPRRREMLARLVAEFRTETAGVDESPLNGESPRDMTVRLALLKAQTVFDRLCVNDDGGDDRGDDGGDKEHAVLGGDTVVAIGDEVFGKPANRDHALTMLGCLSGNTHTVFSAVALVAAGRPVRPVRTMHRLSATEVTFGRLDRRQLEQYCDGDEPFDKAGAYGIQGAGGAFVKHIKGSYSGVVGLPLWETSQLLRELGHD